MLWTAMLRGTATALLTQASQAGGAETVSSRDVSIPDDHTQSFVVFVDEESVGIGGGAPGFRTKGVVTIEIRAIAPVRVVGKDQGRADAEALLDTMIELAKNTLLGGQGFPVTLEVTNGSAIVVPDPVDPNLAKLAPYMMVMGPGIQGNFIAIKSVNGDGTLTLTDVYAGGGGTYRFTCGGFVQLFEEITAVRMFREATAKDNKSHVAGATLEIEGHVTEIYEPVIPDTLNGVTIYVDSVNIFDPNSDFTGQTPFPAAPAPRTSGPDGRPEATIAIDTSP